MDLTRAELEVMNVFWTEKKPLANSDVVALAENKSWKDISIHNIIKSLVNKGAIEEAGIVKRGRALMRVYSPAISCEKYFVDEIFSIGGKENIAQLFSALIHTKSITPTLIDEMSEMLVKRREEVGGESE